MPNDELDWIEMLAAEMAEYLHVTIPTLHQWYADDEPWIDRRRLIDGEEDDSRAVYKYRFCPALFERRYSRWLDIPWTPEAGRWQTSTGLADVLGIKRHNIGDWQSRGLVERRGKQVRYLGTAEYGHHWLPISEQAELLELPRTTLERRLFERDTVDSLQWAHYLVRESEDSGLKWECRVHPAYSSEALTRDDLERLILQDIDS